MKILLSKNVAVLFFVFLFSTVNYSLFAQEAYVKFKTKPSTLLDIEAEKFVGYEVEYRTDKSSTIYLEFLKKGKVIARTVVRITGRQKDSRVLALKFIGDKKLKVASYYEYRLSMYEAPEYIYENRVGEAYSIKNVSLVKRK